MLREIEADPPFASVEELMDLVDALGETEIHIMVSKVRAEVATYLVEHGNGTAGVSGRLIASNAAVECARFARDAIASYFEAEHSGVRLRVWPTSTRLDGLRAKPLDACREYVQPGTGDTRYTIESGERERCIELWLASGEGAVTFLARGVMPKGLEWLRMLGSDLAKVESRVLAPDALVLAKQHPHLAMSWAAGNLHMELPECTARRFPRATNSAEEVEETLQLFRSVRHLAG